ncbi:class I SAM-dependent methyltransferase [Nannocystaceae bacterium ST9]
MSVGKQFGLSHHAYRRFRPNYPEPIYARVLAELGSRRELAVDLGAGTGLVSAALGRHFARVVAVEPDPGMAAHLHETAPQAEIQSVVAEQAELEPGSVDLVTCANAFHWMAGPQVAGAIAGWLREGGLFAGWRYPMPAMPEAVAELVRRAVLIPSAPFLDPAVLDMRGMQRCFAERPEFELVVDEIVANPIAMDLDALIGFLRSVSFVAAFLRSLGDDAAERHLDELGAGLRERLGEGELVVDFALTFMVARRRRL